jgi:hypothetical protein
MLHLNTQRQGEFLGTCEMDFGLPIWFSEENFITLSWCEKVMCECSTRVAYASVRPTRSKFPSTSCSSAGAETVIPSCSETPKKLLPRYAGLRVNARHIDDMWEVRRPIRGSYRHPGLLSNCILSSCLEHNSYCRGYEKVRFSGTSIADLLLACLVPTTLEHETAQKNLSWE